MKFRCLTYFTTVDKNKQDHIIAELNRLLKEEMSLHTVSYEFDKLAQDIRRLGMYFKVIPIIEYYLDDELTFARNKKMQAMKVGDLLTACKFWEREKVLLVEKAGTEGSILRSEPSLFDRSENLILAYLAKTDKERLLRNLIEGYSLKGNI